MNNGKRLIEKNHEFYSEIINNFTNDLKASMNESTHLSYTHYTCTIYLQHELKIVYYIPFFFFFFVLCSLYTDGRERFNNSAAFGWLFQYKCSIYQWMGYKNKEYRAKDKENHFYAIEFSQMREWHDLAGCIISISIASIFDVEMMGSVLWWGMKYYYNY